MRGLCSICTDVFESGSDVAATFCGHTYHTECLNRWLEQSRTCPRCRKNVSKKQVVEKLFFDDAEEQDGREVDLASVENQLAEAKASLRGKDKETSDLTRELTTAKKDLKDLRENVKAMDELYKQERSNSAAMKRELRFQRELQGQAEQAREEAKTLRTKLADLKNVEKIVNGYEDEIQNIINHGDAKQLSTWCCVLQKELQGKREECKTLRNTAETLKKEASHYKRSAFEKTDTLKAAKEQVRILQEEVKDADKEVLKLKKKNEALLKAISSPSDTVRSLAHRLINESPAPRLFDDIGPPSKKMKRDSHNESYVELDMDASADLFDDPDVLDLDKSTELSSAPKPSSEVKTSVLKITSAAEKNARVKPDMKDISNITGMSHFNLFRKKSGMGLADSSSVIRKGYNGFGGHEKFIDVKPNSGFKAPAPVKKPSKPKFGRSKTLSTKTPPLPTLTGFLSQD